MDEFFSFGDTNATAKDDPGDQVLIDLVPIPSENQSSETTDVSDPLTGILPF